MKSAQPINVNLLNSDDFSNTTLGKVLTWALSIGRYIVVFTELIVILSFLSRFKLDRDLTDLNEEIAKQKAIIISYGDLEERFRKTQDKIDIVESLSPPVGHKTLFDDIKARLPLDVKATKLFINNESAQISLEALSMPGFKDVVDSLQQSQYVNAVSLGKVEVKNSQINFDIKLVLKQSN